MLLDDVLPELDASSSLPRERRRGAVSLKELRRQHVTLEDLLLLANGFTMLGDESETIRGRMSDVARCELFSASPPMPWCGCL
jgi:hypothetical protein